MGGSVTLQLALPVWLAEEDSFDSFVYSDNELLVSYLKDFLADTLSPSSQGTVPFSFIHAGASGGKSHLLYASCHFANHNSMSHAFFDMRAIAKFPISIIQHAQEKDVICIDNIDAISADLNWQIAIFDLLNKVIERNQSNASNQHTKVLISASNSPNNSGFSLPDLLSRLNWGTVFQIPSVTDQVSSKIIKNRFEKRGLSTSDDVISFLINRVNRDLTELLKTVDLLDQRSLEAQRRLTIPFVKQILSL